MVLIEKRQSLPPSISRDDDHIDGSRHNPRLRTNGRGAGCFYPKRELSHLCPDPCARLLANTVEACLIPIRAPTSLARLHGVLRLIQHWLRFEQDVWRDDGLSYLCRLLHLATHCYR